MEDALYRCRNKFDKMSDRKRYYVAYTVCFIVVSLGVFIWFMFGKRILFGRLMGGMNIIKRWSIMHNI